MPVAWEDAGDRLVVRNELGSWQVWKRFTWNAARSASAGHGSAREAFRAFLAFTVGTP